VYTIEAILLSYEVKCSSCDLPSVDLLNYKCSSCGQPLEVQLSFNFEAGRIHPDDYNVWRYSTFFPYVKDADVITLGEGWTPLVKFSDNLYFKLENLNPTGSFKDRGSTVLISTLHRLIERPGYISEDSSGNAGASIAAYAARAGLKTKVFVPNAASSLKLRQIQLYTAEVTKVTGDRSRAAAEAQKPEDMKFYVGHILHPLFRDGIRSLAYEIAEQFAWKAPEYVFLPVSAGTLLLGVVGGFRYLVNSNVLDSMPKIVACQTKQVSPLYHRLKNLHYTPPERITSIADALVSVNPPLLELMTKNLREANGDSVVVEEHEIRRASVELVRSGFLVEPSSAVAYAGYRKQLLERKIQQDADTVIVLTGCGLKTMLESF